MIDLHMMQHWDKTNHLEHALKLRFPDTGPPIDVCIFIC